MPLLSQRAYAKHRGMALSSIQKAIASGRITLTPDGRIDSDQADRDWEANTARRPATMTQPSRTRSRHDDDDTDTYGTVQYRKARAVREHYEARLAKLEFEQKVGSLLPTDEVKIAQFNIERQRRDAMLNIADRVCATIAAEVKDILVAVGVPSERADAVSMTRVHTIMTDEIRKGLNDYADSLAN